jgi:hypothetical protein
MDTWTDKDSTNFMSVTGHWISGTKDDPQNWKLRQAQCSVRSGWGKDRGGARCCEIGSAACRLEVCVA